MLGVCAVRLGTVLNKKGKGVKGAVVEVREGVEVIVTSEPTQKDGRFEILVGDSAAELELVVNAPGVDPKTLPIVVERSPQAESPCAPRPLCCPKAPGGTQQSIATTRATVFIELDTSGL